MYVPLASCRARELVRTEIDWGAARRLPRRRLGARAPLERSSTLIVAPVVGGSRRHSVMIGESGSPSPHDVAVFRRSVAASSLHGLVVVIVCTVLDPTATGVTSAMAIAAVGLAVPAGFLRLLGVHGIALVSRRGAEVAMVAVLFAALGALTAWLEAL